ncbi:hypothetical protein QL285_015731 [Trifolium repens]|nr:hypothetical protein QL285_015731 [Trifolium repens]
MVGVVEEVVRTGAGGGISTQLLSSKAAAGIVRVLDPSEVTSSETEPSTPVAPCAPGWDPTGAVQNIPNNTCSGTGKGGVCHSMHSCIRKAPRLVIILTRP